MNEPQTAPIAVDHVAVYEKLRVWLQLDKAKFWEDSIRLDGWASFVHLLFRSGNSAPVLSLMDTTFASLYAWTYRLAEQFSSLVDSVQNVSLSNKNSQSSRGDMHVMKYVLPDDRAESLLLCDRFVNMRKRELLAIAPKMEMLLATTKRGMVTTTSAHSDEKELGTLVMTREYFDALCDEHNNSYHSSQRPLSVELTFCDIFFILDVIMYRAAKLCAK